MADIGASGGTRGVAGKMERHPGLTRSAAVGHAVNGMVHVVLGLIALSVAGGAGGTAGQSGALRGLRSLPAGWAALWFAGIVMAGLAVYAVVIAVQKSRADQGGVGREVARACARATVALATLIFATGGSTGGQDAIESLGAQLLLSWWGAGVLVATGLVTVGAGVEIITRGLTRRFAADVTAAPPAFTALGMAGYIAKGFSVSIIGVLLVVAVVTRDPSNVAGLDGALKSLVTVPGGRLLLYLIAAGFLVYGVFCLERARVTLLRARG